MYDGMVGSVETKVPFVYIRVIGQSILCLSKFLLFALSLAWSFLFITPVVVVGLVEHVLAAELRIQAGADEEGAAHFAVQGISFFWWRDEPLFQHDGDEVVDALRGALRPEVKGLHRGKSLAQDHHRIHVGVHHDLDEEKGLC